MVKHVMVPPEKLREDSGQPRKSRNSMSQKQLDESVAMHGVLQPVGVRYDLVTVVWGWGRVLAAIAAGIKEIPAVALDEGMAEWQYQNLALVENVVRSDISQFELWQGCVRLLEGNPGWGQSDVAKALSFDASNITKIMSPSKCIAPVVEALKAGKINFAHTNAIAKASCPEEQLSLLEFCRAADWAATRDAVEAEVRKNRKPATNSDGETKMASRTKCVVPGKDATIQITAGSSMTLDQMIEVAKEWVKRATRASENGWNSKTLEQACKNEDAKPKP
jgi:ParB family transcriptional regulator, chromosome partitioning protein